MIRIPFEIRNRDGRKLVVAPDGNDAWGPPRARIDNAMSRCLPRAHRRGKPLDTGTYPIAAAEKINASYVSRTCD